MNSARKSYISKSLKRIETIIYWTVFKYPLVFEILYQQEVLLKTTMYMTLRFEMFIGHA